MSTTLANLNTLINDRRRDTGSNSIDMSAEGFRAVNGTLQYWNQMHDWEWQIEDTILNYNEGFTWYTVPTAFKASIDLRPYRSPRTSEFDMVSEASFDSETLKSRRFAVATKGQTEYLRIKTSGDYTQLHTLGDITDGTWTAGGAISNLATDSYEYYDLSSSVSFDYAGTSGTITIDFTNSVDLTSFLGRSVIGWNANFSTWTNWTSMTWRLGSSASAYWTGSVITDYLSLTPTANQWNKFKIDWSDLTKVGSPDIAAIDYVQLTIAFSSNPSLTALRIENLFISENVPLLFEYYSTNMIVSAAASAKTQTFTSTATGTSTLDSPLWSGKWDFATESFVNSTLETIFWITGEYTDLSVAQNKVAVIVNNLKNRIPSRRRYPSVALKFDIT